MSIKLGMTSFAGLVAFSEGIIPAGEVDLVVIAHLADMNAGRVVKFVSIEISNRPESNPLLPCLLLQLGKLFYIFHVGRVGGNYSVALF